MNISQLDTKVIINEILNEKREWRSPNLKAVIHTIEEDYPALSVESIDIDRDYVSGLTDYMQLNLTVLPGIYYKKIDKFKNNLEITLTYENDLFTTFRYKAIYIPRSIEDSATLNIDDVSEEKINQTTFISVSFQLLDRAIEAIRNITVGGTYKNASPSDVLMGLWGQHGSGTKLDGISSITSIDMVPETNMNKSYQILIPSSLKLTKLHDYLQESGPGIYSGGINRYIQHYNTKRRLFIFPPYNYKRIETEKDGVVFYAIDENNAPITESTWIKKDAGLHVLVGSSRSLYNDGESSMMDTGIGFRAMDANIVLKHTNPLNKSIIVGDDEITGKPKDIIKSYISKRRDDGVNFAPLLKPTTNMYRYHSAVNVKLGSVFSFKWINANIDLLFPGMPAVYSFKHNNKTIFLKGIVSKVSATTIPNNNTTALIFLHVEDIDSIIN